MPQTLVLACTAMDYQIHQDFMLSLFRLIFHCNRHGIPVVLDMVSHDPIIPRARNRLTARFLDREDASHILFLSSRVKFSVRQVIFMLTRDVDVLAGPVPPSPAQWRANLDSTADFSAPPTLTGDTLPGKPEPQESGLPRLWQTEEASLDFMLIRRNVITKLAATYPELHYRCGLGDSGPVSTQLYALFDSWIEPESREYLSGDAAFCKRLKNIGCKIRRTNAPL